MEDGGLFSGGPVGRFIDRSTWRRRDREERQSRQDAPLVGAVGVGNGRRTRRGHSIRATWPRARCAMRGSLLDRPFTRERGRRAADNEFIELVEAEVPVGLGRDEVVATGPRGSSHTEAVDQEQHQRPRCPPSQPVVTYEPHRTLAGERETSRSLGSPLDLLYGRFDFSSEENVIPTVARLVYPFAVWPRKWIAQKIPMTCSRDKGQGHRRRFSLRERREQPQGRQHQCSPL